MKRKLSVLLILAAFAGIASAQSNVQIYGVMNAGLSYVDTVATPSTASPRATGSRSSLDSGQYTQSRFGFKGTEDLGDGLKAYFTLEGGIGIDTGASSQGGLTFGRKTVVGLSGKFGEIELGRRKDFSDEIAGMYSSQNRMLPFVSKAHGNNLDRASGERGSNMIYYSSPTISNFRANLAYAFGETAGDSSTGQSIGLGANYDNGPFGIGFSYWQSKLGVVTATANSSSDAGATSNAGCNTVGLGKPGDTCIETWMLGANYDTGNIVFRGTLSQAKQPLITTAGPLAPNFTTTFTSTAGTGLFTAGGSNNSKATIVDVGLDYTIGEWKLKGSIIHSRYDFVKATNRGRLTALAAGADYNLSKRTLLYVMFANMQASNMYSPGLTSNGAPGIDNSQNVLIGGILHKF